MTNDQIAGVFAELADLLEFQGANSFRVRAYRNAARVIRALTEPAAGIVSDPEKRLSDIAGIGKDLSEKVNTLVATGQLPQLKELQAQIPASVRELLNIPGLGPRKASTLYEELGISSPEELKSACEGGRVRELKGFGAKTEAQLLRGIDLAATANQRYLWAHIEPIVEALREHLQESPNLEQLQFAGSYRRGQETVGDIDVLVVSDTPSAVMDWFAEFSDLESVIARGDTKMSVRLRNGPQVDLRVVAAESFGAALQYFTGSKEHNVEIRGRARQRNLKINEYGVFRVDGEDQKYVAGATEEEVYATLDLPCFPPEIRECRFEFEWAEADRPAELLQLKDIRGDLHAHTTATDGKASLEEMVQAARARGLKYLAITDHSQRVSMARGLNAERVLAQWTRIDRLNDELDGKFQVLKGIECDILEKGGMDLPDEVLAQADWVLGSIHYGQQQPRAQLTRRILGALENPHVRAIAHPTGRILNRRQPYEIDFDEILHAAREHGKILELNASPKRLDLNDVLCAAAKGFGVPIVISTDAHSIPALDHMRHGVLQARRAGLTRKDVVNTRTVKQLLQMLK